MIKKTSKKYYCKDCNKVISYQSALYGTSRCLSCCNKGKLNPNYKDGITNIKIYCIDCNNVISNIYAKRCKPCATIINAKKQVGKIVKKSIRLKISKSLVGRFKGRNSPRFGKVSHSKYVKYRGIWFHSSYEVKYAKYLIKNQIKWRYEFTTFDLGNCTYTPDFYLPQTDEYIEVKGYWRDDAKKKFNKFKRKFPKIKIRVVNKKILELLKIL